MKPAFAPAFIAHWTRGFFSREFTRIISKLIRVYSRNSWLIILIKPENRPLDRRPFYLLAIFSAVLPTNGTLYVSPR
jgi:hypothetical protein